VKDYSNAFGASSNVKRDALVVGARVLASLTPSTCFFISVYDPEEALVSQTPLPDSGISGFPSTAIIAGIALYWLRRELFVPSNQEHQPWPRIFFLILQVT